MLMVTGRFSIEPAQREEFLEFARNLVPVERATAGCLSFDIYEDVTEANTFLMVEQWQDEAALDAYTATDQYMEHDDTLHSFVVGEPLWEQYEF